MWLLQTSLKGYPSAVIFQTYDLLNAYQTVYQRDPDQDIGWVSLVLAVKLRMTEFESLSKKKQDLPRLQAKEAEVFAAALQINAFLTLYDRALILAQDRNLVGPHFDCCAELALFKSLEWSPEQIVQATESWIASKPPVPSDHISDQIAEKFGLRL